MSAGVTERLRRLLFLVPYVAKHPGVTVDALAQAAGVSKDTLLDELELLTLVGHPPFQPDDFIDIYVEDERVYVELDQRLSAPPRLTPNEGVALLAAAELLRPVASDALSLALTKLERALPPGALEKAQALRRQLDVKSDAPPDTQTLHRAITQAREVTFDYLTLGRGDTERRRVQPLELKAVRDQWYLSGFCLTRQDVRLFRVDRLSRLELTDTPFTPRTQAPSASREVEPSAPVKVRFAKAAAPYVRERFGDGVRELLSGDVEVHLSWATESWLVPWVLSFGGDARVVEPAWAVDAVRRGAQARLDALPTSTA